MEDFIYVVVNCIDVLFWVIYMLNVPRMLHVMQLESYQNDGMFRWITNNAKKAFKAGGFQLIVTSIAYVVSILVMVLLKDKIELNILSTLWLVRMFIVVLAFLISNIILISKDKKELKNAKKPLKYTARAKRLTVYNFFVLAILEVLFIETIGIESPENVMSLANYIGNIAVLISGLIFTLPVNMIIANW